MKIVNNVVGLFRKADAKAWEFGIMTALAMSELGLPAFCEINANTTANNFMKVLFNFLIFTGVILMAAGAVIVIRRLISNASGKQGQPGGIRKGIGLFIGGLVMAVLKALIKAITGQDPTSFTFF